MDLSNLIYGGDNGNCLITNEASASGTDAVKLYDGTTSASASLHVISGSLFGSDAFVGGSSFAYADKNAGTGNERVDITGVAISGGNGGLDYALTVVPNTSSTIRQAPLAISGITAANKNYDGTTAATLDSSGLHYTGLIGTLTQAPVTSSVVGSISKVYDGTTAVNSGPGSGASL